MPRYRSVRRAELTAMDLTIHALYSRVVCSTHVRRATALLGVSAHTEAVHVRTARNR